jgi:hypothetical protein
MDWSYGLSGRTPTLQVQSPEFKTLAPPKILLKKRKKEVPMCTGKAYNMVQMWFSASQEERPHQR